MLYPIGISYLIQLFSFIFVDRLRKSCSIRVVFFYFLSLSFGLVKHISVSLQLRVMMNLIEFGIVI